MIALVQNVCTFTVSNRTDVVNLFVSSTDNLVECSCISAVEVDVNGKEISQYAVWSYISKSANAFSDQRALKLAFFLNAILMKLVK